MELISTVLISVCDFEVKREQNKEVFLCYSLLSATVIIAFAQGRLAVVSFDVMSIDGTTKLGR